MRLTGCKIWIGCTVRAASRKDHDMWSFGRKHSDFVSLMTCNDTQISHLCMAERSSHRLYSQKVTILSIQTQLLVSHPIESILTAQFSHQSSTTMIAF